MANRELDGRVDPARSRDGAGQSIARLVASVADDMSCEACVIYRFEYDTLYPVCTTAGARATSLRVARDAPFLSAARNDTFQVSDFAAAEADNLGLPQPELAGGRAAAFVAATPIRRSDDRVLGLLVVADSAARTALSAAQSCALSVYAGQLAVRFGRWIVQESTGFESEGEQLRVLRSIVDHLGEAILIMRHGGPTLAEQRIVYVNDALKRASGHVEGELIGRSAFRLLREAMDDDGLNRAETALALVRPVEIQCTGRGGDELSLVPVRDIDGSCTHWIGMFRPPESGMSLLFDEALPGFQHDEPALSRLLSGAQTSAARSLAESVYTDTLTGLYNRRFVLARLQALIKRSRESATSAAGDRVDVLFIDLDGFKQINDTYGHHVGDELLVAIAGRLTSCIRGRDTLARLGGDEFVVIIEQAAGQSDEFASVLCERIIAHLARPFRVKERQIPCGCSIGLARLDEAHAQPDDIMREADEAMYAAKRAGRGRYARFSDDMRRRSAEVVSLRADLHDALNGQEFQLHYQPVMRLDRPGAIHAVEALLRWSHPERGSIAPAVFIPLAEEIGRMGELGAWVVAESCRQLLAWGHAADSCYVCINLSLSELQDPEGIARIRQIVSDSGLQASRVAIEVDEPTLAAQSRYGDSGLSALRATGMRLILDDFGHDAASLSHLAEYDIDALKIGPQFVEQLADSSRSRAIVESLLALGRALNIEIIAEGIETEQQLERLRELGCELGQGLWLTAPEDARSMARELESTGTD